MYAGGVNPHAGGIVLDVTGMDRIIEIDVARGVVICEPGVRFGALAQALKPHGLTLGIVPSTGPTATVGGAASAHALGTGSARFQSFADEVVGLEVVLVDGRIVRTGSAAAGEVGFFHRYGIGPDLTGLFLGGDATLGVVTAVAMWLHPLPPHQETACYGFADEASAAAFIGGLQARGLTRQVWYGSGYDAPSIAARVGQGEPAVDPATLPQFCVGLDFGGEAELVAHDRRLIDSISRDTGGTEFPRFDQVYFHRLRREEIYWYSFAGYFVRSRCALLMTSLPTATMPRFYATVRAQRATWPDFVWGGACVVCRQGLHGAVIAFYDEATQWDAIGPAVAACATDLVRAGCIPYKSGKIWSEQVKGFEPYHSLLRQLKASFDPEGILSPGNIGL